VSSSEANVCEAADKFASLGLAALLLRVALLFEEGQLAARVLRAL
jgi:hypothetical protein